MEWQQLLNCNRRKDNLKKTSIEFLHPLASGRQEIERDYDRLLLLRQLVGLRIKHKFSR